MRLCWYDGGKAILAMVVVQSMYAAMAILSKQAFREGFNVMVFVAYKQGLAFLVLFPASILLNRGKIKNLALGLKGFLWVFVTAVFCTTVTQFCYYQGLNLTSSSMATAMLNLSPGVTLLLSLLLGLEKLKRWSLRSMAKIFGTLICIAGAMCMALYKGSSILLSSEQNLILGSILLLVNVICLSFYFILQVIIKPANQSWNSISRVKNNTNQSINPFFQVILCKHYLDPLSLSVWLSFLAAISSAILTGFIYQNLNIWKIRTQTQLIACLFGGIIETAIPYYLLAWTLATRGPLFAVLFNPLGTVITTTFTFLVLGENLNVGSLVGAFVVIVGLYIVLWGKAEDYGTKTELDQMDDSIEQVDGESDLHEPLVSGTRGVHV